MRMTKLLVAGSAIAFGAAMTATPASAVPTICELNGTSTGLGASATGTFAMACGDGATATGTYAAALGNYSIAVGNYSTAVGVGAEASDTVLVYDFSASVIEGAMGSLSVGFVAQALGNDNVAIGNLSSVADTSLGVGPLALPVNDGTAVGANATVSANGGTALGSSADATAVDATAVGHNAQAVHANSVALGAGTTTTAVDQVHVGGRTVSGVNAGAITATSTDAVNGSQIFTIVATQDARDDAQDVLIAGIAASSVYFDANSTGAPANAVGVDAIAIGEASVANGLDSIAIGRNSLTGATHAGSIALGAGTATTAANQIAVGGRTVTQLANATLSATSTDAVTGQQLFATNTNVTNVTNRVTTAEADILALEAFDVILGDRIDLTDNRSRSGTAVAIAMGGAMFLPDKAFNLTGNVGLYRGAWAGAVNIGALIGSSAAVNAGVGHGFNRKGKTGARAGFTLGW